MIYTATVTSRGQITIPIAVRKHLGLKKSQKVVFALTDDEGASLQKADDFWNLAGSVDSRGIKYSDDLAKKAVAAHIEKKYEGH